MDAMYFDTFVRAVENTPKRERLGVLGDDYLVLPPQTDYGYDATPRNALTFGNMGVDGVHYAILKVGGEVSDESPVIHVGPMDFSEPYVVLGDCFLSYLCRGVWCLRTENGGCVRGRTCGPASARSVLERAFCAFTALR